MTNKINEWLTEEKLSELKSLADGGETMKAIATHIGISVRTLEKWRAKYPEIASVIGYRALSDGERVEKALLRRAVGYSQGEANTNTDGRCSFSVSDSWKKYRVTWTLKQAGDTSIAKWILIRTFNSTIGQEIYVCGCKLEKGNKATDWSPAADDVLSLEERVSTLEAAILSGGEG